MWRSVVWDVGPPLGHSRSRADRGLRSREKPLCRYTLLSSRGFACLMQTPWDLVQAALHSEGRVGPRIAGRSLCGGRFAALRRPVNVARMEGCISRFACTPREAMQRAVPKQSLGSNAAVWDRRSRCGIAA